MTPVFRCNRTYDPTLDIRDPTSLPDPAALPNGALWPILAPRRAGKTWFMRAIEYRLQKRKSRYLDLRHQNLDGFDTENFPRHLAKCLLLDEPGARLQRDPQRFIARCAALRESGRRLLLALSPGEWDLLEAADPRQLHICQKDLRYLPSLTEEEARSMAARSRDAAALLPRLPPAWTRNPFLLELVLQINAEAPGRELRDLLRETVERSSDREYDYLRVVFNEGLSDRQREALRCVARGALALTSPCEVLVRCGLLGREATSLTDPVLQHHLPPPLRIHHISDIHVGPKAAERVDAKDSGRLRDASGAGFVRESYLDHLKALASSSLAPHLLVISGDIAEWATVEQYAEARPWVQAASAELAEHPLLDPGDPRVLLVGGNHDVDWNQTLGLGPSARHQPFARAFADFPRPRLEEPPQRRPVAVVRYADLGVEFLLLGSAEFGGEVEEDRHRAALLEQLGRLPPGTPADATERRRAEELAKQAARDDPGLVHHEDLLRAERHPFCEPVRIAVLHHPVAPIPSSLEIARYSGLLNAGAVKDTLLKLHFCLVLHGHVHSGWFVREQWPGHHGGRALHIASAPSLGSREVQESHGFNQVEVTRDLNGDGEGIYQIGVRRFVRTGLRTFSETDTMGPFAPDGG